jgi:hypothetical protein
MFFAKNNAVKIEKNRGCFAQLDKKHYLRRQF